MPVFTMKIALNTKVFLSDELSGTLIAPLHVRSCIMKHEKPGQDFEHVREYIT
jgi:hypothetical protein